MVQYLAEQGASLIQQCPQRPLLDIAIERGDLSLVKFLVEQGRKDLFNRCPNEYVSVEPLTSFQYAIHENIEPLTSFQYAIYKNKPKIVRYFLTLNIPRKKMDPGGQALIRAAYNKNIDLLEMLLDQGFDINEKDDDGNTVLMNYINRTRFTNRFINDPSIDANSLELSNIVFDHKEEYEVFGFLLKKGASISIENKHGLTALDLASNHPLEYLQFFLFYY